MKIHIQNGRLIAPANRLDGRHDLFVADDKIVAVGTAPDGFTAERTIDASGLVVAPGLIDLAARLREPGFEYKATLESEMDAAMAGGITSLAIPPDTDPVLDEPGLVEMLCYRAKKLNRAHVYPVGALTIGLKGLQRAVLVVPELSLLGALLQAELVAEHVFAEEPQVRRKEVVPGAAEWARGIPGPDAVLGPGVRVKTPKALADDRVAHGVGESDGHSDALSEAFLQGEAVPV